MLNVVRRVAGNGSLGVWEFGSLGVWELNAKRCWCRAKGGVDGLQKRVVKVQQHRQAVCVAFWHPLNLAANPLYCASYNPNRTD